MTTNEHDPVTATTVAHAALRGVDQAHIWATLPDDELRRRAIALCQHHAAAAAIPDDAARERALRAAARDLWSLTSAWIDLHGKAKRHTSPHTRDNYRRGIRELCLAWRFENLLRPRRHAGALWIESLQKSNLKPSTIAVRLAAARCLYVALRWAGATDADPFKDVTSPADPTQPWDKRQPYSSDDITSMRAHAGGADLVLLLLLAHAGLRISEALALTWNDIDMERHDLRVTWGKGGKARRVPLSDSLASALTQWRDVGNDGENGRYVHDYVLPFRTRVTAWHHITALAARAGVKPLGLHALRHAAGTRLYQETRSLDSAAQILGHAQIETTRIYAKWNEQDELRALMGKW